MIQHKDFINADPVLIVYPAGLGGEHIAHTLSVCCDDFEILSTYVNKKVNQYHTICALKYVDLVNDISKFENGLEEKYTGNFVKNKKRIVLKDHPSIKSLEFYKKHLPNITVLYFDLPVPKKYSIAYFVNIAMKKLAVKVECPITDEYILSTLTTTLTEEQKKFIIDETKKFSWVWRHELYKLIDDMLQHKNVELEHVDSIEKLKKDHESNLINTYITFMSEYQFKFKNFNAIDYDGMDTDSTLFWNKMKKVIPNIDIDKAISLTNIWIENNNKLG